MLLNCSQCFEYFNLRSKITVAHLQIVSVAGKNEYQQLDWIETYRVIFWNMIFSKMCTDSLQITSSHYYHYCSLFNFGQNANKC